MFFIIVRMVLRGWLTRRAEASGTTSCDWAYSDSFYNRAVDLWRPLDREDMVQRAFEKCAHYDLDPRDYAYDEDIIFPKEYYSKWFLFSSIEHI